MNTNTIILPFGLVLFLYILLPACAGSTNERADANTEFNRKQSSPVPTPARIASPAVLYDSITDPRDGETYAIITIAELSWTAENMRFESAGSRLNPDNPSQSYGRLYNLTSIAEACPKGWHLPSDLEWDQLEIAHGMPASFVGQGGWRGEHAPNLMSTEGWWEEGHGKDSLGFRVLPAGYYATGQAGLPEGYEALGFGAAFWSSTENGIAAARFMFDQKTFVNKWEDRNNETGMALSCRCVRDYQSMPGVRY